MKKIVIAIDGYSSCGKSTMAKDLAREVGYIYVDTGAMYRAVTLFAMRNNLFDGKGNVEAERLEQLLPQVQISFKLNAETGRPEACLNGEVVENQIRSLEVSQHVSPVAALPFVRAKLVEQQQAMGRDKGIVMDGRDIGTVVLPNARVKIFLTASPEERAKRRYEELTQKGEKVISYEKVLQDMIARDKQDSERAIAPLRPAPDAVKLDTSGNTIEQSIAEILAIVRRKLG